MAAIDNAAYAALVNSILTSQIAPDSVTPTTLDDLFYAINESFYNKINGIQVDGMTNLIPGVGNGQNLEDILSLIMASLNNQSNPNGMIPYLFRAEKTVDQIIPTSFATDASYIISFEDDSTAPNFDTSNIFYRDKFVANIAMVKTFALEKVCLKQVSSISDTWKLQILKNNVEIAASSYVNASAVDEYGNTLASTNGYIFPSLIAPSVSLASGDIITAKLYCVLHGTGGTTVTLKVGNPAGNPVLSNA